MFRAQNQSPPSCDYCHRIEQDFLWSRASGGHCVVPGPKKSTAAVAAEVAEGLYVVDSGHTTLNLVLHVGPHWLQHQH